MWILSLRLQIEYKTFCNWLDDEIIIAGQKLLRHQFSNAGGLRSTLAVSYKKSSVVLPAGGVQIVYITSNHWNCNHIPI